MVKNTVKISFLAWFALLSLCFCACGALGLPGEIFYSSSPSDDSYDFDPSGSGSEFSEVFYGPGKCRYACRDWWRSSPATSEIGTIETLRSGSQPTIVTDACFASRPDFYQYCKYENCFQIFETSNEGLCEQYYCQQNPSLCPSSSSNDSSSSGEIFYSSSSSGDSSDFDPSGPGSGFSEVFYGPGKCRYACRDWWRSSPATSEIGTIETLRFGNQPTIVTDACFASRPDFYQYCKYENCFQIFETSNEDLCEQYYCQHNPSLCPSSSSNDSSSSSTEINSSLSESMQSKMMAK